MKILLFISAYLFISFGTSAQIIDPKDAAKRSAENRANSKIDEGINKGFDKIEEGIGNIFKKKEKKKVEKKTEETESEAETNDSGSSSNANTNRNNSTTKSTPNTTDAGNNSVKTSMKSYSKFDFVAGEKVVAFEDFEQDAVGDFPAKWNTNAGGEVVNVDGQKGKWLKASDRGLFFPDFVNQLPENFTMEFDMMISDDVSNNMSGLMVFFPEVSKRKVTFDASFGTDPQVGFDIHPVAEGDGSSSYAWVFDKNNEKILENNLPIVWKQGMANRISIWRQKSRIRLYINEIKVWDLPRAFDLSLKYSMLFNNNLFGGANFITNLRIAEGAPDTRNKLITEGKLVTRGILFDVNSDKIKPESYGILKEIGTVLKENPTVKVRIIGHTDSDGEDAKNLDLSKRRAASVKNALSTEFGIEANRLETDGKGESQPSDPNTTAQGKANNRRVEFIKL
ncbi:MAG: OmpA family protein [Arcicella sp.]|jgi:outer membrane protein OmpA-like peptidoglycan-associated protein|nr:OmpA family protein [Arcicella sp.]